MSEIVQIPADVLAETQQALDAALALEQRAFGPAGLLAEVRAKLDSCANGSCDKLGGDRKQSGYHLLRRLDELRREIKRDYGIEK